MYTYWTNYTLFEKDTIKNTDSVTYYTDGVHYSGLGIMARETLEPNKNYALKFKLTEDSGNITSLGGHLDFSTETTVTLNGKLLDNSDYKSNDPFQMGFQVTEKVNEVIIYFNTNDYEKDYYMTYQDKLPTSNPIHIQPNRIYTYNENGTTKGAGFGKEYTATISNLKMWEVK